MTTAEVPLKHAGPPLRVCIAALLLMAPALATTQTVYTWTDANGQVHYSQRKPETVEQARTLDIAPPPPTATTDSDPNTEIMRINALAEQLASERQAAEQARREQALRELERRNQELQNELLRQQLEQQREETRERIFIGSPPPYLPPYAPYPSYPPHRPRPPHPYPPKAGPPCQPWPACRHPAPPAPPSRPGPLAKPNPPFQPAPAGIAPRPQAVFRGR
jgi:hypothetical protein